MPDPNPGETIPPHFLYPKCDSTSIDHLKQYLVLWLNHHSFEELPDSLEYYLADPNSDLARGQSNPPKSPRSKRSAGYHLSYCSHIHPHPPSLGQVLPSHLWGVSRPI